jgi:hypothetical protein
MNHYTMVLKLSALKSELRSIGITARKVEDEYQVYPKGRTDLTYFTNDIEDALATGRAMAAVIN